MRVCSRLAGPEIAMVKPWSTSKCVQILCPANSRLDSKIVLAIRVCPGRWNKPDLSRIGRIDLVDGTEMSIFVFPKFANCTLNWATTKQK